jgi:sigma-E factor negative regulatory protein RseC
MELIQKGVHDMNKESEGIVLELRGEYALVMPTSHSGCDAAHCCQGEGVQKVNVEMVNTVNAVEGDKVIFVAKEANMLKAAFIVYVLPLIMIFIGAIAGNLVASNIGSDTTTLSIIGGVLAFILSVVIIKSYDRFAANSRDLKPVIIKVIAK